MANGNSSQDDVNPKQEKTRAGGPDDARGLVDSEEEPAQQVDTPRAGDPDDSRSG